MWLTPIEWKETKVGEGTTKTKKVGGLEEVMEMMEDDNFSFVIQEVERSGQNILQGLALHGIMASDGANGAMRWWSLRATWGA